ncbi:MAG: hypothetical protein ACM3ZU_07640 [Bacteroidota bacterium]
MMRNLWTLYKKELVGMKSNFLFVTAIILVWEIFLGTRQGKWPAEAVFGLSLLPYGFLPVWALIEGIQSFRREWSENTIYVLLSLPTRGWTIAGGKALALVTELTFYMLSVPAFTWLFLKDTAASFLLDTGMKTAMAIDLALKGLMFYWLVLVIVTIVGQFSYVVSSMFERFQWIARVWTFLLSAYVLTRGAQIASPVFSWVPDLPIKTYSEINGISFAGTAFINTAPLVGTILVAVAIFVTTSLLVEKSAEV